MQMLLNNGTVIDDAPSISEKTRRYLSQFWSFPSKEEVAKEKEKYYILEEGVSHFNEPDNNSSEIEM